MGNDYTPFFCISLLLFIVTQVIDIGEFSDMLAEVLSTYNFKNLNELFPTENTTTEFMCRAIHNDLSKRLLGKHFCGKMRVKLFESHKAWATYTKAITP